MTGSQYGSIGIAFCYHFEDLSLISETRMEDRKSWLLQVFIWFLHACIPSTKPNAHNCCHHCHHYCSISGWMGILMKPGTNCKLPLYAHKQSESKHLFDQINTPIIIIPGKERNNQNSRWAEVHLSTDQLDDNQGWWCLLSGIGRYHTSQGRPHFC